MSEAPPARPNEPGSTARGKGSEPAKKTERPSRRSTPSAGERPVAKSFLARLLSKNKPPRRLKFTREGKFFVGITLGVGFAAINTGNNLLYLLLGLLLALIVVSGLMSELSLRDLSVVRRLPARAQVGRPHLVEIEVFNHKRRVPSYAIEVEDLRAGQPADKRCFFLKISPKSAQVAAYRRTPQKRGRDRHVGFRIATRFPFGLFEKSREVPAEGDLIIYPGADPVQLGAAPPGRDIGGESAFGRGYGEDHFGLKSVRDGEDLRDVHWKKSASTGQLMRRERARDAHPETTLRLDVKRPVDATDDFATGFERRIREVSSRVVAHIKRGDRVTLRVSSGDVIRADKTTGSDTVLRYLALVDSIEETSEGTRPPAKEAAE